MKQYKFKDLVLATIIGGIVFGGIGVAAVTLTADQVKYTPSNEKFTATNTKEALDEIYKIAEYEIPADTYFYDSNTSGENIVRYKKVDGKYYLCDENGKVTSEEKNVSDKVLIEYKIGNSNNLETGNAGYSLGNLQLGNKIIKFKLEADPMELNGSSSPVIYYDVRDYNYIKIKPYSNYGTIQVRGSKEETAGANYQNLLKLLEGNVTETILDISDYNFLCIVVQSYSSDSWVGTSTDIEIY